METRAAAAVHGTHRRHDQKHDAELVEVVPPLHEEGRQALHEVAVVEAAGGAEQRGGRHAYDPYVVAEVDALAAAGAAQHEERHYGQCHTRPLHAVEPLAENYQGAHEHHDGACGVDGADDGDGEVLDAVVPECPRREYDHGFQGDEHVVVCRTEGYVVCRAVEPFAAA